jgi:hypothetical protein
MLSFFLFITEKRSEALNFRRMNQLSLRQKSARRRKMWQRVYDEETKQMKWIRSTLKDVKVGSAPFGYTPGHSFAAPNSDSMSFYKDASSLSFASRISSNNKSRTQSQDDPNNVNNTTTTMNTNPLQVQNPHHLSNVIGNHPYNPNHNPHPHSYRPPTQHNDPYNDLLAAANTERNSSASLLHSYHQSKGGMLSPARSATMSPMRRTSKDSFGDSVLYSSSPGFTSVFDEEGGLVWQKVESGAPMVQSHYGPSTAK